MISTIERGFKIENGIASFPMKEYPDWYGIHNVGFIYHNNWSDPEIEYKGKRINACIVEDTMWERFREECDEQEKNADDYIDYFDNHYMREHADEVYELIELAMEEMEVK